MNEIKKKPVTHTGFIALLGRPNAGKSTLLNTLLGEKVAIVSPKPQTTRSRITGVLTENGKQMVFIDTPGIHRPHNKLGEFMNDTALRTIRDVDIAVMVVDGSLPKHDQHDEELIHDLFMQQIPTILVINKSDAAPDQSLLLSHAASLSRLCNFAAVVPLSALTGENVNILKEELCKLLPEGPAFFPEDTLTDQPERTLASELIREKLLYALDEELPHGIGVVIEQMKERDTGDLVDINATVFCEKQSHKGMVIGKNGEVLKKVGTLARRDIEQMLGCKVNLKLWVKVKEDWRNKDGVLREMGYVKTSD